ncbi:hypothetical protein MLD38_008971 [Melastoma candidum]|uniref:Uncharacterized protein n=1 Tax=Melastoma candidum TaxID=119954 RepID=A0ACB9RXH0_9MYRT|nr:hypothetical protein MLD38_008971 [Melastoma candidum]
MRSQRRWLLRPIPVEFAKPVSPLVSTAARRPSEGPSHAASVHARLIKSDLEAYPSDPLCEVIRSYASSPATMTRARLVLAGMARPDSTAFNHVLRGESQGGEPGKAIEVYNRMNSLALAKTHLTFIYLLKSCGRACDVSNGRAVHGHVARSGYDHHVFVSNALIHMYACCLDMVSARMGFDYAAKRDLVSWNTLICGYSQRVQFGEVLGLFAAMREGNVKADAVTMMKVVLACIRLGEDKLSDEAVDYIKENDVHVDVYLGNTLIDMYGRRNLVGLARGVFDRMAERNLVTWNSMIRAYAKMGDLVSARLMFDEMPKKDLVSWTSMITGYAQANDFAAAVRLFQEMMIVKVKPDEVTVSSVLSACSHLGSLDVGLAIHKYIMEHAVKTDNHVLNALIDMYCKCGSVEKAVSVFRGMKDKDAVSWTSVISGLAVNGFATSSLELFSEMLHKGVKPSQGTFVGVLMACAHAGFVDKGLEYFKSMELVHGLKPEMKHYGCVVDLLSRSGYLSKAYEFIIEMPVAPDVVVWRILLSACKLHGNVVLAEVVTKKLVELDPGNCGNYVLLSNTYANSDRWLDATNTRDWMQQSEVLKPTGWSAIEFAVEAYVS